MSRHYRLAGELMTMARRQPEKASGPLTVAAMLMAFAMVNSPLRPIYDLVHHTPLAVRAGSLMVEKPLILWINEGADGLLLFRHWRSADDLF